MSFVQKLKRLLFPTRCLSCRRVIPEGELFCGECEKDRPKKPYIRRHSVEGAGLGGFTVVSPMSFAGGFRKTIYRLKFGNKRALAEPIGRLMAECAAQFPEMTTADVITWAPVSKSKKKQRGYDQSELLVRSVSAALGIPAEKLLTKIKENSVQHDLPGAKRKQNVRGVYRAESGCEGKHIILIDDIVTTGATSDECAKMLFKAGAADVIGLCAADTPLGIVEER